MSLTSNDSPCDFSSLGFPYGCTQLLNGVPLYMGDRMREMRTAYAHFYFSVESQQQVQIFLCLPKNIL
jgi:hypothetical protein